MNKLELNKVFNIDGIKLLQDIVDVAGEESIDMFLCDLPYTFKGKQRVTANKWDTPIDIDKFFELTSILLKPTGVVVLTATNPFSAYLINKSIELENDIRFKNINMINFKYEWIWEKDNGSNFVHVKHQPFKVHEQILIFGKAPTTYNKKGVYMTYNPQFTYSKPYTMIRDMSNVENLEGFKGRTNTKNTDGKRYPRSVQKFNLERGLHPTQKPCSLFEYLINTYTNQNGLVVDICCGSGTTAIASLNTHRNFIVNDIEGKFMDNNIEDLKYWLIEYLNGNSGSDVLESAIKNLKKAIEIPFKINLYRGICVSLDDKNNYSILKGKNIFNDYESFSSDRKIAIDFAYKNYNSLEEERNMPILIKVTESFGVYIPKLVKELNLMQKVPQYIFDEQEYFVNYKDFTCEILNIK